MARDPILTAEEVAAKFVKRYDDSGYGTPRGDRHSPTWAPDEVLALARSHEALRDGIREWAEAKYPDRHGRAVTMLESDARLIALLGEGNDG